ncbi:MAG: hypothetical protein ACKPJJ_16835 [Planctomycetaceae bacterium]
MLASLADPVVQFRMRHGVSTVALLAGQPQQMISCDMPFIDTRHTADQLTRELQRHADFR